MCYIRKGSNKDIIPQQGFLVSQSRHTKTLFELGRNLFFVQVDGRFAELCLHGSARTITSNDIPVTTLIVLRQANREFTMTTIVDMERSDGENNLGRLQEPRRFTIKLKIHHITYILICIKLAQMVLYGKRNSYSGRPI